MQLELNEMLFPSEIVEYAKSLQEANFGAYMRTLIGYLYSFRNQNRLFSTKRSISEAIYSIYFEGETLIMFKKLLFSVIEKLKEESITLKQKYRSEAGYIESRHDKILKSKSSTIKFEEKELQKLQSKIANILHEGCLMDSKSAVSQLHHFLEKILEKFPSLYRPNPVKLDKNIIIDYITLPKLLERLVESSYSSLSDFPQTSVLYTYDLYITAQNLLLYLILRYFEPEPLHMTASELKVYRNEVIKRSKLHVLKIINFWIEERRGDFMRNPEVITILNTFLDLVLPLEKETEIVEALKELSNAREELSQKAMKHKRKLSDKADLHITHHANSCSGTKPDTSLITRVISATTDSLNSFHIKEDVPTLRQVPSVSDLRAKPFNDLFIPFISKNDSTPSSHTSKLTEPSSNRSYGAPSSPKSSRFGFFAAAQAKYKSVYDFNRLFEEDSEKIARYLTAIDAKYFSKIDVSELLNKRWTKNDKSECPYYWRYVDRFNSFCSWIQYIILSHDSLKRRVEITAKFVEIALICLRQYNNHSTSHYIFAALSSLSKWEVISMQDQLLADYEELNKTFIVAENFLVSYKEICGSTKAPAIPNFNFFLKTFLKLQDGVVFTAKLAESNQYSYLKFPLLVLIHDTCKEMRRFQKAKFENIKMSKHDDLYKFVKREYKRGVPLNFENKEEALAKLNKMVHQVKEKQNKYYNFFGTKNTKNSAF